MWAKIALKLTEKTTWLGLASIALGVGQIAKVQEAPAVADALMSVGNVIASGNADPLGVISAGIGAVLLGIRERKD